eukprot:360674-Chlamydomonas_euryale.AAC.7
MYGHPWEYTPAVHTLGWADRHSLVGSIIDQTCRPHEHRALAYLDSTCDSAMGATAAAAAAAAAAGAAAAAAGVGATVAAAAAGTWHPLVLANKCADERPAAAAACARAASTQQGAVPLRSACRALSKPCR